MSTSGEYVPSTWEWVAQQVSDYEESGGTRATTLRDTEMPVIIVTTRGHKSGFIRKFALMRVENEGAYALVASKGGAPEHPAWYHNLVADTAVTIQDGPAVHDYVVRVADGDEYATWWERAVAAYPPYADYQKATTRRIPVFLAERV